MDWFSITRHGETFYLTGWESHVTAGELYDKMVIRLCSDYTVDITNCVQIPNKIGILRQKNHRPFPMGHGWKIPWHSHYKEGCWHDSENISLSYLHLSLISDKAGVYCCHVHLSSELHQEKKRGKREKEFSRIPNLPPVLLLLSKSKILDRKKKARRNGGEKEKKSDSRSCRRSTRCRWRGTACLPWLRRRQKGRCCWWHWCYWRWQRQWQSGRRSRRD